MRIRGAAWREVFGSSVSARTWDVLRECVVNFGPGGSEALAFSAGSTSSQREAWRAGCAGVSVGSAGGLLSFLVKGGRFFAELFGRPKSGFVPPHDRGGNLF